MTPEDFIKHCEKQDPENWPTKIWVNIDGEKVRLRNTQLLKYYRQASKDNDSKKRPRQKAHRDEYIECFICKLERRFHLRTIEECRIYHDAVAKRKWICSYMGYDSVQTFITPLSFFCI